MTRIASIDGSLRSAAEAVVSVYDRGFLYGDAVFEVLRTYDGKPFALDEHLARLRRSAARVFIDVPVSDESLRAELDAALVAAGEGEHYVRIVVTRGSGPPSLDPSTANRPLRVLLVETATPPPRDLYLHGIAAVMVPTRRVADETAAVGAKLVNYLPNLLALREARARGAHEALVVDARGRVIEGASSNVFVVRGGRVATPPESAGILAGITRARLMDAARSLGVEVEERDLLPVDVLGADEVFISSSIREVLPVVRVDDRTVGSGAPGAVARALHRRFRESVGMGRRPMPWE